MPSFSDLESLKTILVSSNTSLTHSGLNLKKDLLAQIFEKSGLIACRKSKNVN